MLFGIRGIEESTVYQRILRKGMAIGRIELREEVCEEVRIEEARETLLRQGRKRLGPPNEQIEAAITALGDLDRLHELTDRISDVSTWDELMASPNQ